MPGLGEGEGNTRKHPLEGHVEITRLDRYKDFQREWIWGIRDRDSVSHPLKRAEHSFSQPLSCHEEPCLPLSSKPYPAHPLRETALRAPSIPPPKVSLIFSLPWIQVIAPRPRPLSQAPRNVTNSLPSFTGPVTWEVFIALQPVSLSCVSAATPPGRLFPTRPSLPPFSGLSPLTQPPTLQIPLTGQSGGWLGGARTFWNRGRLSARHRALPS